MTIRSPSSHSTTRRSRKIALNSALALAIAALGMATFGISPLGISTLGNAAFAAPMSKEITEARQETQIWTTFALSPYLRANSLEVKVENGRATLTGAVDEPVNKELAEQIALGVPGIHEVRNRISVRADAPAQKESAGRRYGGAIDDATVTATVKSKLMWNRHTDGLRIGVVTHDGHVRLEGSADSAATKDLAYALALHTRGVASVDNALVVAPAASPSAMQSAKHVANTAEREVTDAWITTKVKSTFLYSSNVDGHDITVDTAHGMVTLSGKLGSGAERALAIELASNVRGVKTVDATALTF